MKKIILLALCAVFLAACAVNSYRSDFEFANKLAKEGLWQEAIYRWQKGQPAGGGSAALHNNLAVALESLGQFDGSGARIPVGPETGSRQCENPEQLQPFQEKPEEGRQ